MIDADDLEALAAQIMIGLLQPWHFGHARTAPTRPKVKENHLPQEVFGTKNGPVGSFELENVWFPDYWVA